MESGSLFEPGSTRHRDGSSRRAVGRLMPGWRSTADTVRLCSYEGPLLGGRLVKNS